MQLHGVVSETIDGPVLAILPAPAHRRDGAPASCGWWSDANARLPALAESAHKIKLVL